MLTLHDWQNFYILTGTASATLIGLLFVAISAGGYIPAQQAREYTRTFVNPILLVYAQVLFVSCLFLIPLQSTLLFSIVLSALGIFNLLLTGKVLWRIRVVHRDDTEIERNHFVWYTLLPIVVSLLLIGSAVGFFLAIPFTLLIIASVVLATLAVGLRNTWNLMLWLTMHRGVSRAESERLRHEEMIR
jgi:hypothetical protein